MYKYLFTAYYISSTGFINYIFDLLGFHSNNQYLFLDLTVLFCYIHFFNLFRLKFLLNKLIFINYFYFMVGGLFLYCYGLLINGFTDNNGDLRFFYYSIIFILPTLDKKIDFDSFIRFSLLIIFLDLIISIFLRFFYYESFIGKYQYYNPLLCLYGALIINLMSVIGRHKKICFFLNVLISTIAFLSLSRALLISLSIIYIGSRNINFRPKILFSIIIFVIVILILSENYYDFISFMIYESINFDGSIKIRLIGWVDFISANFYYFIFGSGVGSIGENINLKLNDSLVMGTLHNGILVLIYRFGIINLFLLFNLIYEIYKIYVNKFTYMFNYGIISIILFLLFSPLGVDFYFMLYIILGSAVLISTNRDS